VGNRRRKGRKQRKEGEEEGMKERGKEGGMRYKRKSPQCMLGHGPRSGYSLSTVDRMDGAGMGRERRPAGGPSWPLVEEEEEDCLSLSPLHPLSPFSISFFLSLSACLSLSLSHVDKDWGERDGRSCPGGVDRGGRRRGSRIVVFVGACSPHRPSRARVAVALLLLLPCFCCGVGAKVARSGRRGRRGRGRGRGSGSGNDRGRDVSS